ACAAGARTGAVVSRVCKIACEALQIRHDVKGDFAHAVGPVQLSSHSAYGVRKIAPAVLAMWRGFGTRFCAPYGATNPAATPVSGIAHYAVRVENLRVHLN